MVLGVTINPIAFLVVQANNVRLLPVNHSSSFDKILDYIPDLLDKTNNMINKCIQNKKATSEQLIKEIKKNTAKVTENKKDARPKKEPIKPKKDESYEFEYDETFDNNIENEYEEDE